MGVVLPFRSEVAEDVGSDRAIDIIRTLDEDAWPRLMEVAKVPGTKAHEVVKGCGGIEALKPLFSIDALTKKARKKWEPRRVAWRSLGKVLLERGDEHRFMHLPGNGNMKFTLLAKAAGGIPSFYGAVYPASEEERAWLLDLEPRARSLRDDELRAAQERESSDKAARRLHERERQARNREMAHAREEARLIQDKAAADALVEQARGFKGAKYHRLVATIGTGRDRPSQLAAASLGHEVVKASLGWVEAERQKAKEQRAALKKRKEAEAEAEGREAAAPESRHMDVSKVESGFLVMYHPSETITLGSSTRSREARYRVGSRLTVHVVSSKKEAGDVIEAKVAHVNYRRMVDAIASIDAELDAFAKESLTPVMVEEVLGINARERLKWIKDGRLPTSGTASFYKGRKEIVYSLHPVDQIVEIKDNGLVTAWREQDAVKTKVARKQGAKKAAVTRVQNEAKRKTAREQVDQMARDAARLVGSPLAVPLVKLAILATMCSRWAKRRQELDDAKGKDRFYKLKDRALKIFAKQPWTSVRYVPGHRPRVDVTLCHDHRNQFREDRDDIGYDFWGWVEDHGKSIRKCQQCSYSEDSQYYALYDIELVIGEARFSWHVPYSLGRGWLPPKEDLQAVPRHDGEMESAFFYGRPVTEQEQVLWPADRLVKEIEGMLELFEKGRSVPAGTSAVTLSGMLA